MGKCLSTEKIPTNKEEKISAIFVDPKQLFTYDNMYKFFETGKNFIIDGDHQFAAMYPKDTYDQDNKNKNFDDLAFIQFGSLEGESNSDLEGGWKIQIRVNDNDKYNLAKAWNIIKDIIIDERLAKAKVIKKTETLAEDKEQCGKQIIIYQFYNPDKDWEAILNRLENDLLRGQIKSAKVSPSCRSIPNSAYLSYRNDVDQNGKYVSASIAGNNYNPYNHPDPFKNFVIRFNSIDQVDNISENEPGNINKPF